MATQLRLHITDDSVDTWKGPSSCRKVRPCAAHNAIFVLAFQSIGGPSDLPNNSRSRLPWKSLSKTNILCSEPSRAWKPISLQSEECCKDARVFTSLTNSFKPWKSRKDSEISFKMSDSLKPHKLKSWLLHPTMEMTPPRKWCMI